MAHEIIFHHYWTSPFSEKVRLMLGFKGLAWRHVVVPVVMPKPDVVALTGGYRRTPFVQIGADIYCDSARIALLLEELAPQPTLFPASTSFSTLSMGYQSIAPGGHVREHSHGDQVELQICFRGAGHVVVEDYVTVGAYSGVHQFCRVGRHAFIGASSVVVKDALPYARSVGNHARCYGQNTLGLQRRGFSSEEIRRISHAFKLLLASKLNTTQAVERIKQELQGFPEIDYLIEFIETSERGVTK